MCIQGVSLCMGEQNMFIDSLDLNESGNGEKAQDDAQ